MKPEVSRESGLLGKQETPIVLQINSLKHKIFIVTHKHTVSENISHEVGWEYAGEIRQSLNPILWESF